MNTVYYKGKDGQLTSMRTGNSSLRLTNYFNSTNGGVTFKSSNMTTRMNQQGQSMGIGLKTGNHTTYFGSKGRVSGQLTAFR